MTEPRNTSAPDVGRSALYERAHQAAAEKIVTLRHATVDVLLTVAGMVALPALAVSLWRARDTGWQPVYALHIALAAVIVLLALLRRRVASRLLAAGLLTSLFAVAAAGLVFSGVNGESPTALLIFTLAALFAFGWPVALAAAGLAVLLLAGFGAGAPDGLMAGAATGESASAWSAAVRFAIVAGGALLPLAVLLRRVERVLIEQSLAEHRYVDILDATGDAIFVHDPQTGQVLDVNDGMLKLFGFDRETALKSDFAAMSSGLGPYTVKNAVERVRNVARTGPQVFEWQAKRATGDLFWVEVGLRNVAIGGENRVVATVHDITDRKRAELALEKRVLALLQPIPETGEVTFEELFNLEDIQQLQDEFAKATGVASIITHVSGHPITRPSNFCRLCEHVIRGTEKGRCNCYYSDAMLGIANPDGPTVQPCLSGGLWDAGAAITVGGQHIANWLIGQVRDESQSEDRIRAYAREIGADEDAAAEAFGEVTAMSREQFDNVAQALFTLANQLSTMAYQNVQQARLIRERKEAEEARRLLVRELDHRVKNNLAAVLALVTATRERTEDLDAFHEVFAARMRSMALAHEALARHHWHGASVMEIAQPLLRTFDHAGQERFRFDGDEAILPPGAAGPVAMCLNELATNAAKYGALSVDEGHVALSWHKNAKSIEITWAEENGPDVTEPTRTGGGTEIMRGLIEYELSGRIDLAYAPDGLRCTISVPLDSARACDADDA